MRSDTIYVNSEGKGASDALTQADKVAVYKDLCKKDSIHLRLLSEEMMGMMRALTGEREAKFYIEAEGDTIALHLKSRTIMNSEMRRKLLSASSSGKNSSAVGFMGKIKEMFEKLLEPVDSEIPSAMTAGMIFSGTEFADASLLSADLWSLSQYRENVDETMQKEEWDELEKSVVAKLADDVKIGINDNEVEITIFKKIKETV